MVHLSFCGDRMISNEWPKKVPVVRDPINAPAKYEIVEVHNEAELLELKEVVRIEQDNKDLVVNGTIMPGYIQVHKCGCRSQLTYPIIIGDEGQYWRVIKFCVIDAPSPTLPRPSIED